jgi:hypothetical protein
VGQAVGHRHDLDRVAAERRRHADGARAIAAPGRDLADDQAAQVVGRAGRDDRAVAVDDLERGRRRGVGDVELLDRAAEGEGWFGVVAAGGEGADEEESGAAATVRRRYYPQPVKDNGV